MGQRVTSTNPWPTWPTQICWPIVISGPKTRGNEDDSRYLHVFLADRGDSFIIIIIIITQRLTRPVSIVRMTNHRRRQLGSCHGLCLSLCVWRLCIDVARNLNESTSFLVQGLPESRLLWVERRYEVAHRKGDLFRIRLHVGFLEKSRISYSTQSTLLEQLLGSWLNTIRTKTAVNYHCCWNAWITLII